MVLDERDRGIAMRAYAVSFIAAFVALGAWAIGLTEVYWAEGSIPIDYPSHIFWSTFIVGLLSREVGILMGYAGWYSHGEG